MTGKSSLDKAAALMQTDWIAGSLWDGTYRLDKINGKITFVNSDGEPVPAAQ